jgi:arsenate reductase (glutaredoxin)
MTRQTATIYHNPACGTSRNTLALIRHFGIDAKVIEYLKTPPARGEIKALAGAAGLSLHELARKKGTPYGELGLAAKDDGALLDAMAAHPILLNRPIVATERGVALCRPSDVVLDLLPGAPAADACKEDGAPFLHDRAIAGDDPSFIAALQQAGLPVADLGEPGRRFFSYRSLSGAVLGFGGFELYGEDALLRSIVVLPEARGRKVGRNLVALLSYRAWREGARQAWLLTLTAADFFGKTGFTRQAREAAPPVILATQEARSLCPATAVLMSRSLGF